MLDANKNEIYAAVHAGLFIAAFALAALVTMLALVLLMVREGPLRRASACLALGLVALALALSCAEVLYERAHMDALLQGDSPLSPCNYQRLRHGGYGEARASAGLALWAAPFALVVATFVVARSLKWPAWLWWAGAPWALFAAAGYLYLQPLPGRFLWPGQCDLYDDRDAILGSDSQKLSHACVELSGWLKDPSEMAGRLGTDSQEVALPELPRLKKRCLADMLEQLRHRTYYSVTRGEILHSPFLAPEDVAEVTRTIDEIAPLKPWEVPWDGGEETQ